MNLVIDIGNTAVKFIIFDERGACIHQYESKNGDIVPLKRLLEQTPVKRAIISAVAETDEPLSSFLKAMDPKPLWLNEHTILPIRNAYGTPHTLGTDRLAAVVGAGVDFPFRNVLVVDVGTCITYDLITADGYYCGGNIAPGMRMRFQAMHEHTARLPLVGFEGDWPPPLGHTTKEALTSGVLWGIKAEIEAYIHILQTKTDNLQVILTGGDGHIFHKQLVKNYKNITIDEVLVARGLNRILEYNEKEI